MQVVSQELYDGHSRYVLHNKSDTIEIEVSDEELVLTIGEEVEVNE